MRKTVFLVLCGLLIIGGAITADVAAATLPNIKEGSWEITSKTKMPSLPGMPEGMSSSMPAYKSTQCVTKKDFVASMQASDKKQKCKVKKQSIRRSTVSWVVECHGENGKTLSIGKIAFRRTTFKGSIRVKTKEMDMTTAVSGKYIGRCKKK